MLSGAYSAKNINPDRKLQKNLPVMPIIQPVMRPCFLSAVIPDSPMSPNARKQSKNTCAGWIMVGPSIKFKSPKAVQAIIPFAVPQK